MSSTCANIPGSQVSKGSGINVECNRSRGNRMAGCKDGVTELQTVSVMSSGVGKPPSSCVSGTGFAICFSSDISLSEGIYLQQHKEAKRATRFYRCTVRK